MATILQEPGKRLVDARRKYDTLTWESVVSSTWIDADCVPHILSGDRGAYADWVILEQPSSSGLTERRYSTWAAVAPAGFSLWLSHTS
ncbi:MAG: hypothetical protein ACI8PT_004685 [Gammaproteobacteria bacterium]